MELHCNISGIPWVLTNIYAPCTPDGEALFLDWIKNISMLDDVYWLIVGYFNLLRRPGNRNKPGGNVQEMMAFNAAISILGITEIPLKGAKFTWTNK